MIKKWVIGLGMAGVVVMLLFTKQHRPPFSVQAIYEERPFEERFQVRSLSAEEERAVDEALRQSYTYFGCGGQAYAFFSDDGKYVLKFFKQSRFTVPKYLNYLPFMGWYRKRKWEKRRKHLEFDYGSYKIGFENLQEESGLLFVHLNKTAHLKKQLAVKDKEGKEFVVDLDRVQFVVQKRAELVFSKIKAQMIAGDVSGAKKTISEVVALIVTRCKKGYADYDPNIATNCGILNGRAMKIDVGRFARNPNMAEPLYYKAELYHLTRPFRIWLKQDYPELVSHLDKEVIDVIAGP